MPKPPEPKHPACKECPHDPKCTFSGQFTDADVTASRTNHHMNCKFFRCRAGHTRAAREISRAAREPRKESGFVHPRWRKKVVDGKDTWVLPVDTVHKSGYLTPEGEFVVFHGRSLYRTGQMLDPKKLGAREVHIQAGVERAKKRESGD